MIRAFVHCIRALRDFVYYIRVLRNSVLFVISCIFEFFVHFLVQFTGGLFGGLLLRDFIFIVLVVRVSSCRHTAAATIIFEDTRASFRVLLTAVILASLLLVKVRGCRQQQCLCVGFL